MSVHGLFDGRGRRGRYPLPRAPQLRFQRRRDYSRSQCSWHPVFDTQGHEAGAISLGAVASRLKSSRRAEIVDLIRPLVEDQGFRTNSY